MNEKRTGGTLWNTPAGACPSGLADLDLTAAIERLTPEEIAEYKRKLAERLKPYETPSYRDPTWFWNKHYR